MNISFHSTQKGTNIKPAKAQAKVQKKAGFLFFFLILMKQKESSQLGITHHKTGLISAGGRSKSYGGPEDSKGEIGHKFFHFIKF